MAFINLLHNGYQGKLGETVGQKWKNQRTVRTYNPHNNSKSEAQLERRAQYKLEINMISKYYASTQNYIPFTNKGMNKFNCYYRFFSEIMKAPIQPGMFYTVKNYKDKDIFSSQLLKIDGEFYLFIFANKDGTIPKERDLSLSVIININTASPDLIPAQKIEITGYLNKSFAPQNAQGQKTKGCLLKITLDDSTATIKFIAVRKKEGKVVKLSQAIRLPASVNASMDDFADN